MHIYKKSGNKKILDFIITYCKNVIPKLNTLKMRMAASKFLSVQKLKFENSQERIVVPFRSKLFKKKSKKKILILKESLLILFTLITRRYFSSQSQINLMGAYSISHIPIKKSYSLKSCDRAGQSIAHRFSIYKFRNMG